MKFNKISRKVLAYACATAMVFSSVSAYQVLQVSAYEESDYTTIGDDKTVTVGDWTLYAGKWGSNTGEMAYAGSTVDDLSLKVISSDGNSGCWKLQAKHTVTGLTKDTTYDLKLKVKASQAGTLYEKIETPEVIKTGIEIKEGENEVTVQFKATSESTGMVLELSGIPSGTVLDFGGITCTEATEKQEPVEITMDQEFNADGDRELGGYTIYVGQSWNGSTAVAGVDAEDADHIKVQQKTSNWGQAWGLQVKKEFSGLVPGAKYSISWKINAESNDGKVLVTNNEAQIALVGGEQVLTGEFTATESGTGEFVVGMGWVGLTNPIEFFAPEITKISDPETTTENTETTTEAPETTKAQEETTTKSAETTTAKTATTTTVAPAKVTVKKVAIKKATKKKSAKKASIVLKKVSGAAGYQVKVSTSKKFAKKTTVTVNAKSVKVTVKKLKANKTYYVKARAYKKVSGSKVYGKWSKVIKIANK